MSSLADTFYQRAMAMIASAREKNSPVLQTLAPLIGQSLAGGGVLHTFGSGHSDVIAREIVGRAGCLVCVSGLIDPTGGSIENLVGYGTALAGRHDRQYQLLPGETIIVISNSGKNSSPIEVALYAREKGLNVVGLCSATMSAASTTVHPGGRKLHEIADHVLDNLGVPGDTIVDTGGGLMSGPTSTLVGAMLLNLLMLEVLDWMKSNGHPLPVLRSQNLPGAIEHNRTVGAAYKHRLSRPLA